MTIEETHTHSDQDETVDGRTLRRSRNRNAVITALLQMIREGNLQPGAAQIAERAGVSHRSIFRYFDDLDDLVRTAVDQELNDALHIAGIDNIAQGTVVERAQSMVRSRLRLYREVDGTMQVVRMRSYSIPRIEREASAIWELFRIQVRDHFSVELSALPYPLNDYLIDGVLTMTSYDSYSTHLRTLGRTDDEIDASWTASLVALMRP